MKNLRIVGILFLVIFACVLAIAVPMSKVSREDQAVEARERQARAIGLAAETRQLISENKVAIGMTASQCVAAWGEPDRINRSRTAHGKTEQWSYRGGSYLYLDNDILQSIQTGR